MKYNIEITAEHGSPLGMTPAAFLHTHWQKRPLLIRRAFAEFVSPLNPNDLAGLACEESANARLIKHDPKRDRWSVLNGPFNEATFEGLPTSHWTLLVQDVDKWDASVGDLLRHFRFLPQWRIDDVMVSYATDQGSVGAHVDNYDVFLLQAMGKRRWRISADPQAPQAFRSDTELKLLQEFTPTHEWLLEPGDMLYLPPGVPHHGISEGECLTFSIGMRAPSCAEMLVDFAEYIAERTPEERRYTDPDLTVQKHPAEIVTPALERLEHTLKQLQCTDATTLRQWFGAFITRYRSAQTPMPRPRKLDNATLAKRLAQGARLVRNPWCRFAYNRAQRSVEFFASGQQYLCSLKLAHTLDQPHTIEAGVMSKLSAADKQTLLTLINDGHFGLTNDR